MDQWGSPHFNILFQATEAQPGTCEPIRRDGRPACREPSLSRPPLSSPASPRQRTARALCGMKPCRVQAFKGAAVSPGLRRHFASALVSGAPRGPAGMDEACPFSRTLSATRPRDGRREWRIKQQGWRSTGRSSVWPTDTSAEGDDSLAERQV